MKKTLCTVVLLFLCFSCKTRNEAADSSEPKSIGAHYYTWFALWTWDERDRYIFALSKNFDGHLYSCWYITHTANLGDAVAVGNPAGRFLKQRTLVDFVPEVFKKKGWVDFSAFDAKRIQQIMSTEALTSKEGAVSNSENTVVRDSVLHGVEQVLEQALTDDRFEKSEPCPSVDQIQFAD